MPYKFIQYITPVSITTIINLSLILELCTISVFPWSFSQYSPGLSGTSVPPQVLVHLGPKNPHAGSRTQRTDREVLYVD